MVGHDQVGVVADEQPAADGDAGRLELADLVHERHRVDDDAVADDAGDVGMEDARRG